MAVLPQNCHWLLIYATVTLHVFIEETDFKFQGVKMHYKNVFCSSTHLIDTVAEIYTKLASAANSSHGSGCVTGMKGV